MSSQDTGFGRRASPWTNLTMLVTAALMVGCSSPGATPTASPTGTATAVPTLQSSAPLVSPSFTSAPTVGPTAAPTSPPTPATTPSATASAPPTAGPTVEPSPTASAPPSGIVELVAGGGDAEPGDGGPATAVRLLRPAGVASDSDGSVWFVDSNTATVYVVGTDGIIRAATGSLYNPIGIDIGEDGTVYVADSGNYRVVSVTDDGGVVALAGSSLHPGFRGDGGRARRAYLFQPYDVAVDDAGNIYIADTGNNRIRLVDAQSGLIDTIAGDGTAAFGGDDGPATQAQLQRPSAIALDSAGARLFIADTRNTRIRVVDLATGTITTIAGGDLPPTNYVPGLTGLQTPMNHASVIAVDDAGNVYVVVFYSDLGSIVMRMAPTGEMTRVVGGGHSLEAGVAPADFSLPDITALEIDASSGALLMTGADGRVYRVPGVATPAIH